VQRVAGLIEVDRGMPADRIGTVQDDGDRVRVDATNFMQMALAASSTDGLNFMDDVGYGPGDPGSVSTSLGVVTRRLGG